MAGSLIVPCVALLDKRLWGSREKLTGGGKNANLSSELSVRSRRPPRRRGPPMATVMRVNCFIKDGWRKIFHRRGVESAEKDRER